MVGDPEAGHPRLSSGLHIHMQKHTKACTHVHMQANEKEKGGEEKERKGREEKRRRRGKSPKGGVTDSCEP